MDGQACFRTEAASTTLCTHLDGLRSSSSMSILSHLLRPAAGARRAYSAFSKPGGGGYFNSSKSPKVVPASNKANHRLPFKLPNRQSAQSPPAASQTAPRVGTACHGRRQGCNDSLSNACLAACKRSASARRRSTRCTVEFQEWQLSACIDEMKSSKWQINLAILVQSASIAINYLFSMAFIQ